VFREGLARVRQSVKEFVGRANRLLLLATALAFVFNLALMLTSAYRWSYDAYTHMFFADHYVRSWFGLWEPRWFGGFYVTTYPPLVHQCLAFLSIVLGLELAYQVLSLLLMVLIPVAVYCFARVFVSNESAGYASLISVFLPSIGQTAYFAGQLTTLFGIVSCLFASVCVYGFLKYGKAIDFPLAISLLGVSVSSHHFSALFFLPFCLLLSLIMVIIKSCNEVNWKSLVSRLASILVVGGLVSLVVIYPFWSFLLGAQMQVPIYHGSREVFSNPRWTGLYFLNMYGVFLIFVPLTCVFAVKNRELVPLVLVGLFMFVMGLGGTTPLPLILGEWWQWLVYDRFALWAGTLLLPICGLICKVTYERLRKFRLGGFLLTVLLVSLAINCWWVSNLYMVFGHPREVELEEVKAFLDGDDHWRWRYLTLGFGEAQLAELSIMVNATTMDGAYCTGRLLPILRESGVGPVDTSKYYYEIMGNKGLNLLNDILANASSYSLKWVFCSDSFYEPILEGHDFSKLYTFSDGLTAVWYKEEVPMLQLSEFERSNISMTGLTWGIAPIICLLSAASLILYKRWLDRQGSI